ncbi:MAG: asparagine--tRNA ligase, partial [Methanobacteriota archaeon]
MLEKELVERMSRKTHAVREIFQKDLLGERVVLRGWVYRRRSHGNLIFILLRDSTGVIQCSIHKEQVDKKTWEEAERATIESALVVGGVTTHDKRAPGNIELRTHFVDVISLAEPFPIKKDAGKTFLLDNRHLFLRSPKVTSVLKIRAKVCKAAREYLEEEEYVEVHTPSFVTAAVEGGATLFPVNYFGRTAYLTQSGQFYEEAAINGLEKVYCLQPSFRAEKSRTRRHITEYWHLECEVAFGTHEEIM